MSAVLQTAAPFRATQRPGRDMAREYDRIAPVYRKLHRRWLRYAGGEAQAALEGAVRALITPRSQFLDVGCGAGDFARRLMREGAAPEQFTLIDPSEGMLAQCDDLPSPRLKGRIEELPFARGAFDIVTCAWALETSQRTDEALAEMCRVLRPGGVLALAFCAERPPTSLAGWVMETSVKLRGTGRFLEPKTIHRRLERTHGLSVSIIPCGGPATALIARKPIAAGQTQGL